jgi:hypothetical protein
VRAGVAKIIVAAKSNAAPKAIFVRRGICLAPVNWGEANLAGRAGQERRYINDRAQSGWRERRKVGVNSDRISGIY